MEHNEKEAHKLYAKLKKAGISARIDGGGVHWNVEATSNSGRSLSVACFWYERNIHGLILGMNPLNARSRLHKKQRPILQRIFTDQGSSLRPVLLRRGQWSDVYVAKGTRQCILSSDFITCSEDSREFSTACITANDVVRIAIQFLEQQATLDELHTLYGMGDGQ